MKIIKCMLIAFSLYSRIPMPQFEWKDDEYGNAIAFLPFVGMVLAAVQILVYRVCVLTDAPVFVITMLMCAMPLLLTGGFHLDGYMDVCDALNSYAERERCLEIMKDPHIGAFAVIGFARFALLYVASVYFIVDAAAQGFEAGIYVYVLLFVLIRAMCGVSSILLPKARNNGMLNMEVSGKGKFGCCFLILQGVLCVIMILMANLAQGVVVLAVMLFFCLYYMCLCEKRFGGVTGDTAGFFVCRGELLGILALAVYFLVVRL